MPVKARLKDRDLLLEGEIDERIPPMTDGLVSHFPFDGTDKQYVPHKARYIRDWINGSTANSSNHWVQIKAIDGSGNNVALGKSGTSSGGTWNALVTNGSTVSSPYWSPGDWIQVDLGAAYEITEVQVWHYWADGRSYYGAKTEVSEDGLSWFPIFDGTIEGVYKETSAGKTHNLRELKETIAPTRNTNTTLSYEGIAIEDSTKNLWTGGLSVYNNYRTTTTTSLVMLDETYMGEPVYRLSFTVDDASSLNDFRNILGSHGVSGGSLSWVQDTEYNSSIYWRPINKADTKFGGTSSNTSGWSSGPTEYLADGWRRFYRYRTGTGVATKSDVVHHSFSCPSLELKETIMIDIACPQTEEGNIYPKSYTPATRAAGMLEIPFNLKPPYSINVWHKPYVTLSTVTTQSLSPMILQLGDYHTNASISLWNLNKKLSVYCKGDTGTGWSASGAIRTYTDAEWNNQEHMYTLVMSTNRKVKVYMDGKYVGEVNSSVDVTNISKLVFNTYKPNAIYRNLSMYNRELGASEIEKLHKNTFSINKEGNLVTSKVLERPVGIPLDTYYISLGETARDEIGLITPSSEVNTVYEDGVIWLGRETTNILTEEKQTFKTFSSYQGTVSVVEQDVEVLEWGTKQATRIKTSGGTTTLKYYSAIETSIAGQDYTASVLIKNLSPNSMRFRTQIGNSVTIEPEETTLAIVSGVGNGTSSYQFRFESLKVEDELDFIAYKPQVEKAIFRTPFTEGTRGLSKLEFNLHRDLQLDWSGDWTISYWKKPVSTHTDTFTGYNFESLGSSPNSIGGGYMWFGKNTGVNALKSNSGSNSPAFNPDDYFNHWHLVTVSKSGNQVTYSNRSSSMKTFESKTTVSTVAPNYYLSQLGYDLKLGGSNGTQAVNSWFKDLMVTKRALTSEELDTIHSTGMRTMQSTIQIGSQIKEGQSLN